MAEPLWSKYNNYSLNWTNLEYKNFYSKKHRRMHAQKMKANSRSVHPEHKRTATSAHAVKTTWRKKFHMSSFVRSDCHKQSSIFCLFVLPTVVTGRMPSTWHRSWKQAALQENKTHLKAFLLIHTSFTGSTHKIVTKKKILITKTKQKKKILSNHLCY